MNKQRIRLSTLCLLIAAVSLILCAATAGRDTVLRENTDTSSITSITSDTSDTAPFIPVIADTNTDNITESDCDSSSDIPPDTTDYTDSDTETPPETESDPSDITDTLPESNTESAVPDDTGSAVPDNTESETAADTTAESTSDIQTEPVSTAEETVPPAPPVMGTVIITAKSSTVTVGNTLALSASVCPSEAKCLTVTWSIKSGDEFVSVNGSGVVTARTPGNAVVTAVADDGEGHTASADFTVTVTPVYVTSIKISVPLNYVHIGNTLDFAAAVFPAGAADRSVSWSVTDGSAVIDENGTLTPEKAGTVTVAASACDGSGVRAAYSITVVSEDTVLVGISNMNSSTKEQVFRNAVAKTGAASVVLPMAATEKEANYVTDRIDCLIMTGGEDIDPSYYGEKPSKYLGSVNAPRDTADVLILDRAIERRIPILCVCRGMQILNVVLGGTLVQDIPSEVSDALIHRDPYLKEFVTHQISVSEGSITASLIGAGSVTVNSWHHQAVEKLGHDLVVTASSSDGIVEAIEMTDRPYVVGVQFHPERLLDNTGVKFLNFFTALVNAAAGKPLT